MTWNVYRNIETNKYIMLPSNEATPENCVLEVVTANPEYLINEGLAAEEYESNV